MTASIQNFKKLLARDDVRVLLALTICACVMLLPSGLMALTGTKSTLSAGTVKITQSAINDSAAGFTQLFLLIQGVLQSGLGKLLAISAGVIGLGIGVMMGKVMPAVAGITVALMAIVGPKVIGGVFSAVI